MGGHIRKYNIHLGEEKKTTKKKQNKQQTKNF